MRRIVPVIRGNIPALSRLDRFDANNEDQLGRAPRRSHELSRVLAAPLWGILWGVPITPETGHNRTTRKILVQNVD